jgi:leader peptidase (prepilin peptidase)/N-methyltransferase
MVQLLGAGFLGIFTVPLVVIDVRERRLPNKITLPAIALSLIGVCLAMHWDRTLWAIASAVLVFGIAVVISIRGWFGMGDAKLLAAMALTLCWYSLGAFGLSLAVTFMVAGVVVGARLLLGKVTIHSTIALGPYLLLGFWVALVGQLVIK